MASFRRHQAFVKRPQDWPEGKGMTSQPPSDCYVSGMREEVRWGIVVLRSVVDLLDIDVRLARRRTGGLPTWRRRPSY